MFSMLEAHRQGGCTPMETIQKKAEEKTHLMRQNLAVQNEYSYPVLV
jgi:hypothetical protein